MDNVNVSIPANADYLHVLRSVLGSLGALADASIDVIDDLRISVDEACSQLLMSGNGGGTLSMQVRRDPGTVDVVASIDAAPEPWPPAGADESLAWQLLQALVDEASFERTEQGVGIRFRKRL